ncbi:phosphoadenosine phosphosulfate reductase [PVC group bacterium (ex Bugula neritina AB1)]|nr:phosphoadenosine phosphosulfate reductase [PVC group bacterium (ex Bugula neritina AB1)]
MSAKEIIQWAFDSFGEKNVILASSLSVEDQVLTDMVCELAESPRVLTLDTGRLFQESYDVIQMSMDKYKISYEISFPEAKEVLDLVTEKGPNLFYNSVMDRKECCYVRKVRPLKKSLEKASLWITGIRKDQSVTRENLSHVEWDNHFGLYKINPILDWSEKDVWKYIKKNKVPYSSLQDKGFLSIGCAPCTRAVEKGQDIRAGRWWWEAPESKECGLHVSA